MITLEKLMEELNINQIDEVVGGATTSQIINGRNTSGRAGWTWTTKAGHMVFTWDN